MDDAPQFLRLPAVLRRVGVKKTKLYALIKAHDFPAPVKLGNMSVWPEDRVVAWQHEKMAA